MSLEVYGPNVLLNAPVAVVNLGLEGDLEIRKQHDFAWPFLTGAELVFWAEDDGVVIGCQVLSKKNGGRVWWYEVSYVKPAYRGQGVLAEVRKAVRAAAKTDGTVQFIEYLIACDNEAMLKSTQKAGMQPANYHYRYRV